MTTVAIGKPKIESIVYEDSYDNDDGSITHTFYFKDVMCLYTTNNLVIEIGEVQEIIYFTIKNKSKIIKKTIEHYERENAFSIDIEWDNGVSCSFIQDDPFVYLARPIKKKYKKPSKLITIKNSLLFSFINKWNRFVKLFEIDVFKVISRVSKKMKKEK